MLSVMIPQALFSHQHAHKFLVFTAGQKCSEARSSSLPRINWARMKRHPEMETVHWAGLPAQEAAGPSRHFLQEWGIVVQLRKKCIHSERHSWLPKEEKAQTLGKESQLSFPRDSAGVE